MNVATLFSKIIRGELPGRFVWRDERAVVFLTIEPLTPGHVLVVPVAEVDHWLDLEPELVTHLNAVAQDVGKAIQAAFGSERVGLVVAGFEVPHVHLHVFGANTMSDFDFARIDRNPAPADLDDAASKLRRALREAGHTEVSD